MTKVQCGECGNIQESYAQVFFNCGKCRARNLIENSRYTEPEPHGNRKVVTPETQQNTTQEKSGVEKPEIISVADKTLEIQDAGEPEPEKEQEYKCPDCNQPLKKFGDCTNPDCLAEIYWRE